MRLVVTTAALALTLIVASAGAWADGPAKTLVERVDSFMAAEMARQHVPGASVAVVKDGKVVLTKGYGLADVELGVPATADTVYEIGSITKQFTATAIMMLVDEGKVGLDDKASKYLTFLPAAWDGVTIRHLLTHTSGIKSYTNLPGFLKNLRHDYTPEEVVRLSFDQPLEFQPGEKFDYDNTGYFMLGIVIEKASGKPYGGFLKERIFAPLGMTSTRVNRLRDIIKNRASGYSWDGKALKNAEYLSMTQPGGAGVLVSTVRDMAKWDLALNSETLLKRADLKQMWTPYKLKSGKGTGYGFGWAVMDRPGHRGVGHGGGIPGFSTDIHRYLDDHLTVVVFTNSDGANPGRMAEHVAGMLVPALAPPADLPAEADKDPALTAKHRALVEAVIAGKAERDQFTPEMQKVLFGPDSAAMREQLAPLGALKSFTLIADRSGDGVRSRLYRAEFEHGVFAATVATTKAGKVAGIGMRPE